MIAIEFENEMKPKLNFGKRIRIENNEKVRDEFNEIVEDSLMTSREMTKQE